MFTMCLEICKQIYSVVFAQVEKLKSKKYAKTFNFLSAGNKGFVTYQAQEGALITNHPTPLRTPLTFISSRSQTENVKAHTCNLFSLILDLHGSSQRQLSCRVLSLTYHLCSICLERDVCPIRR